MFKYKEGPFLPTKEEYRGFYSDREIYERTILGSYLNTPNLGAAYKSENINAVWERNYAPNMDLKALLTIFPSLWIAHSNVRPYVQTNSAAIVAYHVADCLAAIAGSYQDQQPLITLTHRSINYGSHKLEHISNLLAPHFANGLPERMSVAITGLEPSPNNAQLRSDPGLYNIDVLYQLIEQNSRASSLDEVKRKVKISLEIPSQNKPNVLTMPSHQVTGQELLTFHHLIASTINPLDIRHSETNIPLSQIQPMFSSGPMSIFKGFSGYR